MGFSCPPFQATFSARGALWGKQQSLPSWNSRADGGDGAAGPRDAQGAGLLSPSLPRPSGAGAGTEGSQEW